MSFCTDPNSIISIDINECVGNSLTTMNANFNIIKNEICDQHSNVISNESEKNILTNQVISLSSQLNLIPKCSVKFNDEGTIISGEAISNVERLSTGIFRVFFTNNFNDTNYLTIASNISETPCFIFITDESTNYVEIKTRNSSGNLINPNFINLIFFTQTL